MGDLPSFSSALVVGCGSWGTGMATLLAQSLERVVVWCREAEVAREINEQRANARYLPGVSLSERIVATRDWGEVRGAELIVLAVPTSAMREVAGRLAQEGLGEEVVLLSVSKGIERGSGARMSEILRGFFTRQAVAVLSGPNHAEEVARQLPAAASLSATDEGASARLQALLTLPRFRAYTSRDLIGVELGGAMKNAYAIAAGVAKGLALGDNAISALVTRALAEMTRLGTAMGAQAETFYGLSGVGDLMTTCFSPHSRNHRVGLGLAKGLALETVVGRLGMVAEGVPNSAAFYEVAQREGVRTPLLNMVYEVVHEGLAPDRALNALFERSPRQEGE